MVMLFILNILNKKIKDKEEREILKEFRDYLIETDFDIKNETIDSSNSIIVFSDFCDYWLSKELMKDDIRSFIKKCNLISNIFLILKYHQKTFEGKVYIYKIKRKYLSAYYSVAKNVTSDSNFFLKNKDEESDDNILDNSPNISELKDLEEDIVSDFNLN